MNLLVSIVDYIKVFFGGVLVSFTPCAYPLVPVVLGVIGARSSGSKLKGFTLSLLYVTGLAITYSILGLIAALTGRLFGEIATHPASYLFSGFIFIYAACFSPLSAIVFMQPAMIPEAARNAAANPLPGDCIDAATLPCNSTRVGILESSSAPLASNTEPSRKAPLICNAGTFPLHATSSFATSTILSPP